MPITIPQKTALVTGSSRGLGRGIALKLAEAGVKKIAINYKENDAAAQETARLLKERGAEALLLKADVGNMDHIKAMFAKIKQAWGSLDIYVSNARATLATGFYAGPMDVSLEQWQATYDSQVKEFLVATREAVSMMGKNGRIICITYAGRLQGQLAALGCDGLSQGGEGIGRPLLRGRARDEGHHRQHHQPRGLR